MTDSLTRLMVREHLPETTRILIPRSGFSFIRESLEMLGLHDLATAVDHSCIQPDRYYFCSPTAMTGTWNPLGFDWLRKKFSSFLQPAGDGQPVFLTRRKSTRVPENIEAIEDKFRLHGFRIVDCGSLTLKDQMAVTSSAPAIAGLHGAAMTNLLWSRPGTPVLELFQSSYLNACYEQIAFQGRLDYEYAILDDPDSADTVARWIAGCKVSHSA